MGELDDLAAAAREARESHGRAVESMGAAAAVAAADGARVWIVMEQGQRRGPYSQRELANLYAAGKLSDAAQVWQQDWPAWQPITRYVRRPPGIGAGMRPADVQRAVAVAAALLVLGVLGLLMCSGGSRRGGASGTRTAALPPAAPAYTVDARNLVEAFMADGRSASSKYNGAIVEVTGRVILADSGGFGMVALEGRGQVVVLCYVSNTSAAVKGSTVTVAGTCTGWAEPGKAIGVVGGQVKKTQ